MTDSTSPRRSKRTALIIVAILVAVILAVAGIGLLSAVGAKSGAPASPPASENGTPLVTVSPTPSATTPRPTTKPTKFTPTPAATAPTPQPTRTATISSAAPITPALTAKVSRMEAVQGTASAPGEIAGPSVRFTIQITNTTGKRFDLSNTVVNVYAGSDRSPAVPLAEPGGRPFPGSVANGATATGVFVFNIPKADRARVEVTVDTSVLNPVIAFKGAAPTS